MRADITELRGLTARPFGVNLFAPPGPPADPAELERYASELREDAERYDVQPGEPRHDDDSYEEKLALMVEERVPVVSFTFGCPAQREIERLHDVGIEAWVTITTPGEATSATEAGADTLVVQGVEAGGHRATFDDDRPGDLGLFALLQLLGRTIELPLVATGGIATGRGVAAVLAAGASAAQVGTGFMLAPEAGTSPAHRQALAGAARQRSRALTRDARHRSRRFMGRHDARHTATVVRRPRPVRAASRGVGGMESAPPGRCKAGREARGTPVQERREDIVKDSIALSATATQVHIVARALGKPSASRPRSFSSRARRSRASANPSGVVL